MANEPIEKIYEDVQLHIAFSQAASRSNIVTYDSTAQEPENISTAFGKLSKWYEALVPTGGSSGKILVWNSSGTAKWSDPLHPTITKSADTTSTASPAHGGTFTTVDSVTRDANGHVTKINTKTVTLPSDQNTDTLVSQTFATASNKRPLLMSYYKVGEAAGTAQVAYRNDSLYCNPSNGRIFATGFYTSGWDTSPAATSASLQANGLVLRAIKTYGDGHTLDYNRYVVRTYSGKTGLNTSDWSSNGMLVTVEGGGLTIVGGGESAASLAGLISDDYLPASGTPNSLDVNGDTTTGTGYLHTSLSGSSENLILSADTEIYFVTNANTIANRKAARLTSDLYFAPLSTNTGSIGTSTYQWNTIFGKTIYENGTSLASKYAAIGHTHTTTIAADSGTNQLTLAASTKYKLTAGETNFIFTTPPNTTYSAGTGLSLSGTTINHSNSVTAVTNYNKPYVKYDAQGHITGSSYWTATAAGTGGESGWVKVATMVHTANYDNTPIMLLVSQRGNTITYKLHIVWKNASNTDPDLDKFQLSSDISTSVSAYIKKSATSTWELYIKKMDNYDAIAMHLYAGKYFPDHMTWTWQDVQTAASAITGGTEADKIVPFNSYKSRTANTVLAAPNGSDGAASFRTLVADDLPYASTSAYGITKLSSSTSSTSTALAATSSAVKSAYDLAAGKSTVSFSRNLTSGTKVGTITIDGTATDLYCQTNTNTDTLVSQTFATADHNRPLLMSYYDTGVETTTAQVVHRNDALYFNPSGGVLRSPRLYLQTTGMPITINLDTLQPTAGENVNVLAVRYKNTDGTATHTVCPIGIFGNDATGSSATVNSGVRLGSTNGTTIVGAGESGVTFAAAQAKYNDENLYFVADGAVYMYTSCSNDSTTVTGPWRVGGFTTGTSAITSGRVMITDGTTGGFKASDYTIAKSVPSDAKFSDTTYSAGNHLTLSSTTFKIADYCKNLNGGDWNTASTNGWYMGSACTNAPDSNWWMGRVVAHNNKYCIQEVWNFNVSAPDNTNPDAMYMPHKRRWFRNENWGPWVDVSTPTPSAKVDCQWDTVASRTTNVTRGWMAYWDGSYNGSSSNLTYCNKGAFGTIVTKNTGDYVPNTQAGVNAAINLLSTGSSNPTLADYYISQYAGGGTTTTSYHRRPISALWNTFKGLITLETTGSGNAVTAVSIANDGDNNRKITVTKGTTFSTTDEKVKATKLAQSTAEAAYYPTLVSAAGTAGVSIFDSAKINHTPGTTSVVGNTRLILGNATNEGTANNEEGLLRIYSPGTKYHTIKFAKITSANVDHTFPTTGGTVLNTGTTSFTQTLSSGTKIGSIKINGSSTDIYAPTNTNTTYTFATGDAVGQIKVTPSGGTATNYNVNGIAAGTASGTAKHLAYYSSATSITSGANLIYSVEDSTASTPRSRTILHLVGSQTVGNDATALISGTKGVLSYGDGGPQINFSTSATIGGAQDSAIIWTDNDSAAAGASWHFVSSQSDWNVISKRFHARTGISIGTNLPQTSYNLYVNGTTFHSGGITFGSTTDVVSPVFSIYTRTSSNYNTTVKWSNGSTWGTYGAEIGYHNTGGDSTNPGTICILPYQTTTQPWNGGVGLFIKKDHVYIDGVELSKSGHTHSYIPMSGSTGVTGNIKITKDSGDTGFYAKRSDTGVEVWMGVGSGGTNHGIYSNKLGKWMMYGDATNVYLNGNATTSSSWATARTLTLGGQLTGSVSVKGDANMTLNGYMDRAFIYDDNAVANGHTWAEYAWHKFAEVTIATTYTDCVITFLVSRTYGNSAENVGILSAKLRTKGSKDYDSAQLKWLVRNSGLSKDDFVMVYTSTSGTNTKAELWCRLPSQYAGLIFTVLKEHLRHYSTNASWTLVKTPDGSGSTHGSSSYPTTGITGTIVSSDGTITNSTTGNAATATTAANADVTVTDVPSTSTTTADSWYKSYGLIFAQNPNTTQSNTLRKSHNLRFYHSPNGTADTVGVGELVVGNNTASGTAGNMQGRLVLYSSSSSYHTIVGAATSTARTITIPAATGSIILGTKGSTSYYGLIDGDASTSNWIRGTSNGFLPSASAKFFQTATSSLGTSTWYFKNSYIQNMTSNKLVLGAAKTADGAQKGQLKFYSGNGQDVTGTVTLECVDDAAHSSDYTVKLPTCNGALPVFEKLFDAGGSASVSLSFSDINDYDMFFVVIVNSNGDTEPCVVASTWISNVAGVHDMPLIYGGAPNMSGGSCNVTSAWIQISKNSGTTTFVVAHKQNIAQMTSSGWTISSPTYNLYIRKIYGLKAFKRT